MYTRFIRVSLLLPALLATTLVIGSTGCTKPGVGGACKTTKDCSSGLACYLDACAKACTADSQCASGTACGNGYCEQACTSQGDCSSTFACVQAAPTDKSATCYPVLYQQPAAGGFGTSCSQYTCNGGDSPCADGFQCASSNGPVVKCDPNAICTAACTKDLDCPANYFCAIEPTVDGGISDLCLPRQRCDPCVTDDACGAAPLGGSVPGDYVCVADNANGHFCGKECSTDKDCLHPYVAQGGNGNVTFGAFESCQADASGRKACTPTTGACEGKSALPSSFPGDNTMCSPCRPGIPSDCVGSSGIGAICEADADCKSGLTCRENGCTKACTANSDCGDAAACSQTTNFCVNLQVCYPGPFGEMSCITGCDINTDFTTNQNSADFCEQVSDTETDCYSYSHDTCPSGTYCWFGGEIDPTDCHTAGSSCTVQGICSADPQRLGQTCYVPSGL